ncbi:hypothetical protein [Roseospirillum parvum]|uniref:Cholesterol transport system auxiliary component n=1 Tax=Roseospirillum parvum TaxID=83401 RepID=A0A1G8FNI8_9PROT|nr:hypothetical protein [Roseospirillum parvum]SDH83644.1 hypothetical protein SAMN05421742_11517 [Roseospirillum parvum]
MIRPTRRLLVLVLLPLVVLAGCAQAPPLPRYPEIRFDHLEPITLAASELLVESTFEPSFEPPHVEHLFPQPPEKVARTWARDRLKPDGEGDGFIRVLIRDASAVEEVLDRSSGLKGALTTEQSERYTVTLDLAVQILDSRRIMRAEATARGSRTRTVAEDASLNEREQVWFEMTETLIQALNKDLEAAISTHLAPYRRQ